MGIVENIKSLALKHGTSIPKLEKEFGFGKGAMYNWNKNSPSVDKLQKVADYFGVSTDYLIYGFHREQLATLPALTPKDEAEIARDLEAMLDSLDDKNGMAAYNDPEDEEDRELLKASLLTSMRLAKQIAKKKFTPKKYRKE